MVSGTAVTKGFHHKKVFRILNSLKLEICTFTNLGHCSILNMISLCKGQSDQTLFCLHSTAYYKYEHVKNVPLMGNKENNLRFPVIGK